MNDSETIQHDAADSTRMDGEIPEQQDLWRRAQTSPIPLAEKIAHALFAATILIFYFLGSNESAPLILGFLWFISFSTARYQRQQTQIDALRELLQANARK
jgi:hypothetical protein